MENRIFLENHLAQTTLYPMGLKIVRAQGLYLYDEDGKAYADMISGIGVSNMGHGQPSVLNAIREQSEKYLHVMVYGEFLQEPQRLFAQLLTDQLPKNLNAVYFVNSGAEANEAALKLAKRVTGRTRIVSCKKSYHGNTHGALSISGNEMKKYAFRPLLPEIYFVEFNHIDELEAIDSETACFIMETVQGDAGIRIPSMEYMKAVRERCDETGAMLIFDEIQCGMGRTGKFSAFEHWNIHPDILTLGKALGGGLPIGATVSSVANMEQFTYDPMLGHITTFGGHPLICAAGHASLKTMLEPGVIQGAFEKGKYIRELLGTHPLVKEIRQIGLFIAIDLLDEQAVQHTVGRCIERGVIIFWFLSCPASFRLAPPLNISTKEIKENCDIIRLVLDEVAHDRNHQSL